MPSKYASWLVVALLVCAWGAPPSQAKEVPVAEWGAATAAFPAPETQDSLTIVGGLFLGGAKKIGAFELQAKPAKLDDDGTMGWVVREKVQIKTSSEQRYFLLTLLTRSLEPVRGRVEAWGAKGKHRISWTRTPVGVTQVHTSEGGKRTEAKVEAPGPFLPSPGCAVLFGRLAPAAARTYQAGFVDVSHVPSQLQTLAIQTTPPIPQAAGSNAVEIRYGTHRYRVKFSAGRRLPQALTWLIARKNGTLKLDVLPETRNPGADIFAQPAKTPEAAAMQVQLAFATAQRSLMESTVRWPKFYEALQITHKRQGKTDPLPTLEAWKEGLIQAHLKENPKPPSDADYRQLLLKHRNKIVVKPVREFVAEVLLPKELGYGKVLVVQIDGVWKANLPPARR